MSNSFDMYRLITTEEYLCEKISAPIWHSDPAVIMGYQTFFGKSTDKHFILNSSQTLSAEAIRGSQIFFYSHIQFYPLKTLVASYNNEHEPLCYYKLPNNEAQGVMAIKVTVQENGVVSSGTLSGCIAASLYIPEKNLLWFYHVGQRYSGNEYKLEAKNRDLYLAIVQCLNLRKHDLNSKEKKNGINDLQMKEKLSNIINRYNEYIVINIFSPYFGTKPANLSECNTKGCIYIRKYAGNYTAFFMSTFTPTLFSQHYFKGHAGNTNNTYSHDYRVNVAEHKL